MLPTYRKFDDKPPRSRRYLLYLNYLAKNYTILIISGLTVTLLLWRILSPLGITVSRHPVDPLPTPLPPVYSRHHNELLKLPQHHWQNDKPLPFERFFYVSGHGRGTGWGNAMEELLFNAYLAYRANRAFVFNNYTWTDDDMSNPYAEYKGKKIPARIPYNVIIGGPIVGEPWPAGDQAPLAVSRLYYEKMCPNPVVYVREDVHSHLKEVYNNREITDRWVAKLNSNSNPCVETARDSGPIYTYMEFGDPNAMRDIWPEFSTSTIMTTFRWSPLVELAFDTNRELWLSGPVFEQYLSQRPFTTNKDRYPMIPGLLVIHVRRGDYEEHCVNLANWSSTWLGFNSFPEMVDKFVPPGGNTPETHEFYRKHCYPTVKEIVEKVRAVRKTAAGQDLRKLYIMTNGTPDFILELKLALWKEGDWQHIASSRDMVLNWEQKYVSHSVDMLVAQRAQVLIGNGWSTMTSNAVMFRMANGFHMESIRFF